jgi:hypothetical protein
MTAVVVFSAALVLGLVGASVAWARVALRLGPAALRVLSRRWRADAAKDQETRIQAMEKQVEKMVEDRNNELLQLRSGRR